METAIKSSPLKGTEENRPLDMDDNAAALKVIKTIQEKLKENENSLVPLSTLLSLRGRPYSLENHFPFEPFFKKRVPKNSVWKCARQVAKTTSTSASGIIRHGAMPFLSSLYMTPLGEQIKRLSSDNVGAFIKQSIIRELIIDESCTQNVFKRTFANNSTMHFSFAFLDAERIRGITADQVHIDEVQDMDYDFLPIIMECMSASPLAISGYTGTPKSLDNTIEALWQDSSQAEWVTKCEGCGKWNMAHEDAELYKMIGKDTVVCAFCEHSLNPRTGHWYHTNPEAKGFAGYHVPQVIMPMHYENTEKWDQLIAKSQGRNNYTKTKYLNEVLGVSCDTGVNLTSLTDIRKACAAGNWNNEFKKACEVAKRCRTRVLAVDWGGGGEEETSFTSVALVGSYPGTRRLSVLYVEKFPLHCSRELEITTILKYFRNSGSHYLAHDFGGAGDIREAMLVQSGLPVDRVCNIMYVSSPNKNLMFYHPPAAEASTRGFYSVDKTRSLVLQASCIKSGLMIFPEYESSRECLHDLLNLIEERKERPRASDIFLIRRRPKHSDDTAHAINFGALCIYHTESQWPDLSEANRFKLTKEQMSFADPVDNWGGIIHSH